MAGDQMGFTYDNKEKIFGLHEEPKARLDHYLSD